MDEETTNKLPPGTSTPEEHPYTALKSTIPLTDETTDQMPPVPLKDSSPQIHGVWSWHSSGLQMPPVPLKDSSPQPPPAEPDVSSFPTAPIPPSRKGRKRWPTWARILFTVFLLLLVVGGGLLVYGYYYFNTNIQAPLSKFIHPVSRGPDEPFVSPAWPDGNIMGRSWNILLLGSDDDQKYTFPAVLTQVMMLVHVDTVHNSVTMVSIPRDSWVYVPEVGGMHKIDQAFFLGATQNVSFDDGVRLARLTVEKDYGIAIDRYAWVGLSGFASVIDTLGGVDIDVAHPILDDNYPDDTGKNITPDDPNALKRLYIAPGPQHMDGLQALEYVRSRHADLVGDIGRTHRQQQVLEALKKKVNVTNVLNHLQQLIADLSGKVYTDLSEQEILSFANYARTLPSSAISRITLGPGNGDQDYGDLSSVYDPSVNSDQDVVIPNCATIQPLINRVFELGNVQSCNVTGNP